MNDPRVKRDPELDHLYAEYENLKATIASLKETQELIKYKLRAVTRKVRNLSNLLAMKG